PRLGRDRDLPPCPRLHPAGRLRTPLRVARRVVAVESSRAGEGGAGGATGVPDRSEQGDPGPLRARFRRGPRARRSGRIGGARAANGGGIGGGPPQVRSPGGIAPNVTGRTTPRARSLS